jgi:dephospho-CoA kinase
MSKIIAVIGMCGSGKSEAVKFFVEKGYQKVYFGGIVIQEVKQQGLDLNEENERRVREELRSEFGMGVMALQSLRKIQEYFKEGDIVIDGLYSWAEFKIVKDKFGESFKLLTVYTTKSLRYKRLAERKVRPLNEQETISRDYSELEKLDKGAPIAFTDYLVTNDSTLEDLYKQLQRYI